MWSFGLVWLISAETYKPLDEIAALSWCDNTDNPRLPHIYWDPPIPHSVSQQDTAMLCGNNIQWNYSVKMCLH